MTNQSSVKSTPTMLSIYRTTAYTAYTAAWAWQSRAATRRHLLVFLRHWQTVALPPILEPIILLTAFGLGLGAHIPQISWQGSSVDYLTYLAPGIVTYTAFMTAFFQSLFNAFIRMHYQKTWDGQLTTQIRIEHVLWGEALWAASVSCIYVVIVLLVLAGFDIFGWITLQWWHTILALPFLFFVALAFACLGLLFTATVADVNHMNIPFFLMIMPLGFTSSTYFPITSTSEWTQALLMLNPLHHVAEGMRWLMVKGVWSWHIHMATAMLVTMLLVLIPIDLHLLKRRVLGET